MKTKCFLLFIGLLCAQAIMAQALRADFRADKTRTCTPSIVSFEDMSSGNPTAWKWDFGNGNTSTLRNPTTTYIESGTYTVSLIVTRDSLVHDTLVREAYIQVARNPEISFSATQVAGCSPVRLRFNDATRTDSANRLVLWEWDFGDGSTSTEASPEHVYREEGAYAVTLKVTDDLGCTDVELRPRYIKVSGGIAPAFSASVPPPCGAPAAVRFTNSSSGPGTLSYTWLFGDGSTSTEANPTHAYQTTDSFDVSLIVRSSEGCIDTLTRPKLVHIETFNTGFFLEGVACPGVPAQLVNKSKPTPVTALWRFPDGTTSTDVNPVKTFAAPGTYAVQLINTYDGCADTLEQNITVAAPPLISFSTADTAKCEPALTTRFQNNTNAARFAWEFGDNEFSTEANPTHVYRNFGYYSVTLTATSAEGCIASLTRPNYIRVEKPSIRLKDAQRIGCLPFVYSPELVVDGSADPVVQYRWDFGDGQTATGAQPTVTYTRQGRYNVTVTITTAGGCTVSQVFSEAVKVGTLPTADFSAAPLDACASEGISFTNLSTGADEYRWDFGDGSSSTAFAPKHVYADTGYLDVQLTAFNSGCADTILRKAYVYIKPPVAAFTLTRDCADPLLFRFSDLSLGAETWAWNFGDGTVASGRTPPAHRFPGPGTYTVRLTTTNGACTHSATREVWIGKALLNFNADTLVTCKPANINLFPTGSDLRGIGSLRWQVFNDTFLLEQVSGSGGTNVRLEKAGNYNVRLITVDTFGCPRDTLEKMRYIRVNGPEAAFSSPNTQTCLGSTVDFLDNTATDGQNKVVSWEWNFGTDGSRKTFSAPPFTHRYDTLGSFNVRLRVTDAAGCTDVITKQLFVRTSTIKAEWTGPTQTCPGAPIGFINATNANVFTSVWDFGDGDTAHAINPQHAYQDTGRFTVKLKVTNSSGCTDSLIRPAYVYSGLPVADFDAVNFVTYCIPYEARFFNRSTYATSQVWDFTQGISRLENPTTYFVTKGEYKILLTATSPGGCTDTASRILTVKDPTEGSITYATRRDCRPITVDFKAFDDIKGRFVWDFGNGIVADTNTNVIEHTYNDFGSYVPKVILYEPTGCVLALTGTDTLMALGVRAKFGINQNLFCDNGTLVITDSTTSNDSRVDYLWRFGDGPAQSTQKAPTHFFNRPGTYQVTLTTTTNSGCQDSTATFVKVSETPVIGIDGDTAFCALERRPYNSILQNPNSDSIRWSWSLPNGSNTTVRNPGMQVFGDSGTFTIQAVATNPDGCADTSLKRIRVHPLPVIRTPQPITIVAGQTALLPVTYQGGIRRYLWSPEQSLSCATCPQPLAGPSFNTRYVINVVDSNSCRASGEVQVNVTCSGANVFAPNTFSPNGDGRNDVFFLRGTGLDRVRLLRIFNRWGEVVFERRECPINDPSVGWDGRFRGTKPQPDVYVYQAEVYCISGEVIRWEGNVALIQ